MLIVQDEQVVLASPGDGPGPASDEGVPWPFSTVRTTRTGSPCDLSLSRRLTRTSDTVQYADGGIGERLRIVDTTACCIWPAYGHSRCHTHRRPGSVMAARTLPSAYQARPRTCSPSSNWTNLQLGGHIEDANFTVSCPCCKDALAGESATASRYTASTFRDTWAQSFSVYSSRRLDRITLTGMH